MDTDRLLTPREAAAYLRLNPRTVTRLAREGKLPAVRIGKRWRFRPDALAGWSRQRTVEMPRPSEHPGTPPLELHIADLVSRRSVICNLVARDKAEALEKIVVGLENEGILSEGRLFLKLLMEREDLMSTNIAEGVAVPHPRRAVEGMFPSSLVAVAVSRRGVDFGGGAPVRVFFTICAADDRWHLRILARLSRLLVETPLLERLLSARFPEEVISAIRAQEESLGGSVKLDAS